MFSSILEFYVYDRVYLKFLMGICASLFEFMSGFFVLVYFNVCEKAYFIFMRLRSLGVYNMIFSGILMLLIFHRDFKTENSTNFSSYNFHSIPLHNLQFIRQSY